MRRLHWLLAGLALAIGAGALAQSTGGYPSNARFSNIGVARTPPVTAGQAAVSVQSPTSGGLARVGVLNTAGSSGGGICISSTANICETTIGANVLDLYSTGAIQVSAPGGMALLQATAPQFGIYGTTTGATSQAYLAFRDSAGTRNGYMGMTGQGSGDTVVESDNGSIKLIANTGQAVYISYDGGASFQPLPKRMASAYVIGSASNCTFGSGSNLVASGCTRNGIGDYTVTGMTFSSSGSYACTATMSNSGTLGTVYTLQIDGTQIRVRSNPNGAEFTFAMVCSGS